MREKKKPKSFQPKSFAYPIFSGLVTKTSEKTNAIAILTKIMDAALSILLLIKLLRS